MPSHSQNGGTVNFRKFRKLLLLRVNRGWCVTELVLGGPGVISNQFSKNPKSPWEGEVPAEPKDAAAVQAFGSE